MVKEEKKNKKPRISIVIPSYNKKKYIGHTLQSIVYQNYPNLEVIIQDGGSTDGTLAIIKTFAKRYPDIFQWVSKKDKGQLDAINKGFNKASGDILAFINADDIYQPQAFKVVSDTFVKQPNLLWLAGRGKVINNKGIEIARLITIFKNILLSHATYSKLLITNFLNQPSVFITRRAYLKYGPFVGTGKFVMEYDLWLKLGKLQMPVNIDTTLSSFRMSKGNITSNDFKDLLSNDYRVVKKYTNNPFILFLHMILNNMRIIINKLLNYD